MKFLTSDLKMKLLQEFMGSFTIVYLTALSLVEKDLQTISAFSVSLVYGISTLLMTWICYDKSGAHFNPIITISMMILR